jgi:hypothetical protein
MAPQNAYPRLRPFDVSANPDLPGSNRIDRYTRSGVGLTYLEWFASPSGQVCASPSAHGVAR